MVASGDETNREAVASKIYWKLLFTNFKRHSDDKTNAALNYGYAIVRAAIARELVLFGLQPALGLHHHSELNGFNLADDFIEPLRPIADSWIISSLIFNTEENRLSKEERATITKLLQLTVIINGKRQRLLAALKIMIQSLITATEQRNWQTIQLPHIVTPPVLMAMS